MHVSVQKFTSTTWPRSSAGPSCFELSQSVAPANGGMGSRSNMVALPQRPERRADLFRGQSRLLPGREVPASSDLVEVDQVRVRALRPALRYKHPGPPEYLDRLRRKDPCTDL